MKRWINLLVVALAMVTALAAAPAFSQEVSRSIVLKRDAKIGDQVLPKGEYAMKYVEGKDELVILRGKREVLKATYKVSKLDKAASNTVAVYSQEADGSYQLKRIEFKGNDSALVFDNTVARAINR
jgi:hypothetical protein